jgi:hypothetical protein
MALPFENGTFVSGFQIVGHFTAIKMADHSKTAPEIIGSMPFSVLFLSHGLKTRHLN